VSIGASRATLIAGNTSTKISDYWHGERACDTIASRKLKGGLRSSITQHSRFVHA
jgi:hypothetical protein